MRVDVHKGKELVEPTTCGFKDPKEESKEGLGAQVLYVCHPTKEWRELRLAMIYSIRSAGI